MINVDIMVATQAQPSFKLNSFYKPIFVGADNCKPESYNVFKYRDNNGESISKDNPKYCELTALYWTWKNKLESEIIGLCHYRRFFLFQTKRYFDIDRLPFHDLDHSIIESLNTVPDKIIEFARAGGWIIAPRKRLGTTLYRSYIDDPVCNKSDFDIMIDVILQLYPEYTGSLNLFMSTNALNHFNMFMTSKDSVELYCNWLFNILAAVDSRLNYLGRTTQQMRVLGFLGERLLSLYLYHNNLATKEILIGYYKPNHRAHYVYRGNNIWLRQFTYQSLSSLQPLAKTLMAKV